ncbi:MAG: T9SS type A sorting domain-containing protein [Candidatus Marinimicrobia bacterium]|nr:T9SS type A sorting domain-containing protein [Candidatus Neomarinimicrobiota bacterium]
MKTIKVSVLMLLLLASSLLFGQAYQVTAMNGYSVNKPKLDVVGDQAMITFATNFSFYSFPLAGPSAPITTPVYPDPNAYAPNIVDIAHANGQVYIVYTDYKRNDQNGLYEVRYITKTIGSSDWTIPIILDTVSIGYSIMMTYTNQDLQVGANGAYLLWRNQLDDNSIYFSKSYGSLFSQKRKVLGDSLSLIKDYSFTVIPVEGTDHLFMIYAQDSSLFFVSSSDEGSTFSEPTKIDSLEGFWSYFYDLQIVGLSNGTLYAKAQYWQMIQHWGEEEPPFEEEPPMTSTRLYCSKDFGAHWSIVNTLPEGNSQIALTPGGTIVLTQYPDANLYVKTSTDAISWSDSVRINPNENTATGLSDIGFDVWIIDETTMAVAWIDTTTGYDEIWYRTLTIPTPPLVSIEKDGINTPQKAILVQNYPNPFNPVTKFSYQLPSESFVELSIFDINGRLVDKIVNQFQPAGYYSVQWNAGNYSTGVYLYKFRADNFQQVGKCLLLK